MSITQIQFNYMFRFLASPAGVLSIAAFVLLLSVSLLFRSVKWGVLSAMLFAATLSVNATVGLRSPLMFPLEQIKVQGRPLTIALLILFLIGLSVAPSGPRKKYFVAGTLCFFIFQFVSAFQQMFALNFMRGGAAILIFILLFLIFAIALPRAIQKWSDTSKLIGALAGCAAIFAGVNLLQFIVRPSVMAVQGRFFGTTPNPQFAASTCAILMLPLLYMAIRPGRSRVGRIAVIGACSLLFIMLLWTGSRTGIIMAAAGVALLFRTRLNRFAVVTILVGSCLLLAINIIPQTGSTDFISQHLFSTENTRSAVWHQLVEDFIHSPVTGTIYSGGIDIRENSYLSVAARYGMIGLIPFCIAIVLILRALYRLERVRKSLPDVMMADLVIAGLVQLGVGSIFEGFLCGTLTLELFTVYLYLALLAFLLEYAELPQFSEEMLMEVAPDQPELPEAAGPAWGGF